MKLQKGGTKKVSEKETGLVMGLLSAAAAAVASEASGVHHGDSGP